MRYLPVLVAVLVTAPVLDAAPTHIIATPQETTGPFSHNYFHDVTTPFSDHIIGWVDLAPGTNTYDPVTGDLSISLNIYSDAGLTDLIGGATGEGHGLVLDGLPSVGHIHFEFDGVDWDDATIYFADFYYVTSTAGHVANSWDPPYLTLWGADVREDENGQFYSTIGLDIVAQTSMPEPGTLCLMACGLGALAARARRRRRAAAIAA